MSPLFVALALFVSAGPDAGDPGGGLDASVDLDDAGFPVGGGSGTTGGGTGNVGGGTGTTGGGTGTTGGGTGTVGGGTGTTGGGTGTVGGGTGTVGGGTGTVGGGTGTVGGGTGTMGGGSGGGFTGGGTGGGAVTGGGIGGGNGGGFTGGGTGGANGIDAGTGPIDAGTGTIDAGPPIDTWADLAWTPAGDVTGAVWVDERRDLSFDMPRRRGADLWVNAWRADGGLSSPYGQILCPASAKDTYSLPRIAAAPDGVVVIAWRVATAGTPGHSIRVATVSDAGVSSCSEVLVPNEGASITSLQLRHSLGEFLAVWTTPSEVRGRYVRMPASPSFTIASAAAPIVTLAATERGFLAAWEQRGLFWSVDVPTFASGLTSPPALSSFTAQFPVTQPTAAGPKPMGAFIGGAAPRSVYFGPVLSTMVADSPVKGPPAGEHPLFTTTLGELRTLVAHESATPGRFMVTEFGAATHSTPLLPAGLEPQALVNDGRRALLLLGTRASTLAVVQLVPQPAGPPQVVTPFLTTQPEPDQLGATLVRTAAGGWLVGWNEGLSYNTVPYAPDGTPGNLTSRARAGGVSSLTQVADGAGLALNVSTLQQTNVYPYSPDTGPDATPLLTASGAHRSTLVGLQTAAVWTAGGEAITFGRGNPTPHAFNGAVLGRCGVWAEGALFIPMLENGGELRVIEFKDQEGSEPIVHPLGPAPGGVLLPCLAARGTDFLVVAGDTAGGLFVAMTSLGDVRADRPARVLPFIAADNRLAALPVAAPTPRGWQLAWESIDAVTSNIVGMVLAADGTVLAAPTPLSRGLDERLPLLAGSPGGMVALSLHRFVDRTGNVEVVTKFLAQDGSPLDAGVTEPDGGVVGMQPIIYSSCGCQAGALPTLLGLALLLLSRRRAPARS